MVAINSPQKEYITEEFKKLVHKNDLISRKEFSGCAFVKCAFNETVFQDCRFLDCTFTGCDLNLARLTGCSFANTQFKDSQVLGINWTETQWATSRIPFAPVHFSGCVINYSIFMGLNLKKITLRKCSARDVSFEDANLTQADCAFTDFSNSRFLRTNLTEANFIGATNYDIAPNLNTLKKTKFSLPEAMSLLYNLDIQLVDDPSENT